MVSISASTEQWLACAPFGLVIVDATGHIQLINRYAEELFGYTRNELVGQTTEVLVPESAAADHRRLRDTYFDSPRPRPMGVDLDLVGRRKDGGEFPMDVSLSSLETSQGMMVSVSVRDISLRKEHESTIRDFAASSRLAAIVESSQDAIIGKTLDGVITSWNAGAAFVYGYAADEIIGRNISALIPLDRVDELVPIIERVKRGESVRLLDTQRVAKDGRILDASVTISPIRDASGAVTGISSVARDITEIKQNLVYQRALEAQLHRAQRLESLGQLAGGVAHDFNNVLAGIMNYASLISSGLREQMDRQGLADDEALEAVLGDVDQITHATKRAATLTKQLLIFSRREVLPPQVLDLNSVVGDMDALLRTTIGQHAYRLQTTFASDLPSIMADRGQIEQVVMNLVVNARDAMPDGGELGIETALFELDHEASLRGELDRGTYVRLTVSDTGTGMSGEIAARAFEPFFTTKPVGEGTGLGLATVFGIVRQAGGDVAIYSEPGLGTTVRILFPALADSNPQRRASEQPVPIATNETVLLVEDDATEREPTRRILKGFGYAVLAARNAAEALAIVRCHPGTLDLLLTDVVMTGRSGSELAVDVLAISPTTKVLFMSGHSKTVIVHKGVVDEDVNLIEKPFSADDLSRRVREALDRPR
jgi:PAS domain S-box-containing protein